MSMAPPSIISTVDPVREHFSFSMSHIRDLASRVGSIGVVALAVFTATTVVSMPLTVALTVLTIAPSIYSFGSAVSSHNEYQVKKIANIAFLIIGAAVGGTVLGLSFRCAVYLAYSVRILNITKIFAGISGCCGVVGFGGEVVSKIFDYLHSRVHLLNEDSSCQERLQNWIKRNRGVSLFWPVVMLFPDTVESGSSLAFVMRDKESITDYLQRTFDEFDEIGEYIYAGSRQYDEMRDRFDNTLNKITSLLSLADRGTQQRLSFMVLNYLPILSKIASYCHAGNKLNLFLQNRVLWSFFEIKAQAALEDIGSVINREATMRSLLLKLQQLNIDPNCTDLRRACLQEFTEFRQKIQNVKIAINSWQGLRQFIPRGFRGFVPNIMKLNEYITDASFRDEIDLLSREILGCEVSHEIPARSGKRHLKGLFSLVVRIKSKIGKILYQEKPPAPQEQEEVKLSEIAIKLAGMTIMPQSKEDDDLDDDDVVGALPIRIVEYETEFGWSVDQIDSKLKELGLYTRRDLYDKGILLKDGYGDGGGVKQRLYDCVHRKSRFYRVINLVVNVVPLLTAPYIAVAGAVVGIAFHCFERVGSSFADVMKEYSESGWFSFGFCNISLVKSLFASTEADKAREGNFVGAGSRTRFQMISQDFLVAYLKMATKSIPLLNWGVVFSYSLAVGREVALRGEGLLRKACRI